ncbi:acyltransferase family protein [Leptothrix discophora]|uniref:Acyltransferase family protein n=1 Tax=Leptothrix discophora TaxID=89 RepID=A0ABT9G0A4_LEPDI|nr:acyltransferase family protein [Leptothrix discophora]MDP4299909.1 acyltransferase family protein [Leptothrix discophora]
MNSFTPVRAARSSRHGWVDIAKGICIIAVVGLYARNDLEALFGQAGWLDPWSAFARPFRMPDFFLLSGLFLSAVIQRPWRSYLDTKVAHYVYFLVLWVAILLAYDTAVLGHEPAAGSAIATVKLYIWKLIYPDHMLWFIQTLPAFFIVTRLLHRVPRWLLWLVAAAAMASHVRTGFAPLDNFNAYYVFFLSGHFGAPLIHHLAEKARQRPPLTWGLIVLWAVLNQAAVSAGLTHVGGLDLLAGFVGISAIIALSSLIADVSWLRWLSYAGSNSIVVYLGFYIPLTQFTRLVHAQLPELPMHLVATLSVLCGAAVPLLLHRLIKDSALRFLFVRPRWAKLVTTASPAAAQSA